jgi:hypothetical protein
VTKAVQEVHLDKQVTLLDSPGVVFADAGADGAAAAALRNTVKIEQLADPALPVAEIVRRCPAKQLMTVYRTAAFEGADQFLQHVATVSEDCCGLVVGGRFGRGRPRISWGGQSLLLQFLCCRLGAASMFATTCWLVCCERLTPRLMVFVVLSPACAACLQSRGKLKKGGAVDVEAAARIVLQVHLWLSVPVAECAWERKEACSPCSPPVSAALLVISCLCCALGALLLHALRPRIACSCCPQKRSQVGPPQ